jgi:hypothetical protein
MCQELVSSIPKMQLKTLKFELLVDLVDGSKQSLLRAVKTNASLYKVSGVTTVCTTFLALTNSTKTCLTKKIFVN